MKIEAGKYYRTRGGEKVGPMNVPPKDGRWAPRIAADDGKDGWYADGKYTTLGQNLQDLIAEWSDAPDLTAINVPFGLLDRETQEALKAHGGPWEHFFGRAWRPTIADPDSWGDYMAYRVKPTPPKPREWWMFHTGNLEGFKVFDYEDHAQRACGGRHITHVREVLPEQPQPKEPDQ